MKRQPQDRPSIFNKRFIGAADLAKFFDRPCAEHKGTAPLEGRRARPCTKGCDRWDTRRTLRWMRSAGIALELGERVKGKPVVTTIRKLIDLDGVGEVIMQRMTPEDVSRLLGELAD